LSLKVFTGKSQGDSLWFALKTVNNQSINQSKHISIAPYVAMWISSSKTFHGCRPALENVLYFN